MYTVNRLPGFYLVFEGIVGVGKSKQVELLVPALTKLFSGIKILTTHEPGGNPEADELRMIVKNQTLDPEQETRLFVRSRGITLPQIVLPHLREDYLVASDRSFLTSLAYQGFGRELGLRMVWYMNRNVVNGFFPDCVVHLNVGLEEALARSGKTNPDKFDKEGEDFMRRVVGGYEGTFRFLEKISPMSQIIRVDDPEGQLSPLETQTAILEKLSPLIREWQESLD